ncbi:LA2681 family HEPN domain-containing protein [Burkholderia territorii]|uniref:LA2681 family HEPN domain-containing protein n=1 Tax=Burkholderia territorii TaxID=1503055 RepID=UPI000AE12124|nr:LA2681 family HEPN domain-containing protein [Burkholderia territorii]
MNSPNFESLGDEDALHQIGLMIDSGADANDGELIDSAIRSLDYLATRSTLTGQQRVLQHYFRANAFETKLRQIGEVQTTKWDIPYLDTVLHELRSAVRHIDFPTLDPLRQCQILTNLGSKLNSVGRPVEALQVWDRAISIIPGFAIALGNRASSLTYYGRSLYEENHGALLILCAYDSYLAATAQDAVFDSPESYTHRSTFAKQAEYIAEQLNIDRARDILNEKFSLGRSKIERSYRTWALQKRLFLNPLNDIGEHEIAACDVLHLPSLISNISAEPPALFGLYNQMKQEYVSARWLCFEGLTEGREHFSDRDTNLYDIFGIPAYSLFVEKMKLAFRMAYSLLDKVAFFVNDYFGIGWPDHKVTFRSVWYKPKNESKSLSTVFTDCSNWSLQGLYWLSRDIYDPTFKAVAEPNAEGLAEFRNHLEHKYCQVYEDLGIEYSKESMIRNDTSIGLHIGRGALESKTLHILGTARAALIYLSLAIHREEIERNKKRDPGIIVQAPLWTLKK